MARKPGTFKAGFIWRGNIALSRPDFYGANLALFDPIRRFFSVKFSIKTKTIFKSKKVGLQINS